jgi:hypothetical protein
MLVLRILLVLDAVASSFIAVVLVFDVVANRPIPGLQPLAFVGAALFIVGGIWLVVVSSAQKSRRTGGARPLARLAGPHDSELFGGMKARTRQFAYPVVLLAFISAFSAVPAIYDGGPATPGQPGSHCRWPLDNHGTISCVSHARYLAAGAGAQRFVLSVLFVFYFAQMTEFARERNLRRARGSHDIAVA